jgi:hypothetical protein
MLEILAVATIGATRLVAADFLFAASRAAEGKHVFRCIFNAHDTDDLSDSLESWLT